MEKKINWLEITQAKENEILEALREMYAEAADGIGVYTLEINSSGELSTYQEPSRSTYSADLFHGRAITVAQWDAFRCQDGDEFEGFPHEDPWLLTEKERDAFVEWAKAEGYESGDGEILDDEITPALLDEWDPAVADRWDAEYRRDHISAYADKTAREVYEGFIRDLEQWHR